MAGEISASGQNPAALFTLTIHRGEGMALLGMNWKAGKPPREFVGFSIAYKEPGGDRFFALKNRITFPEADGSVGSQAKPTSAAPIQKFRWVHFPRNAELSGEFVYKVEPVFMNELEELSYGEPQIVGIELRRETYPGQLNVTYTRGFVSSQAFVDRYESAGPISTLLPPVAKQGLTFTPTHPKTAEALKWMGFEARDAILKVLDEAVESVDAEVRVIAYDLNEPGIVSRLEALGERVRVIIDDKDDHGEEDSAETQAEERLIESAGEDQVLRQHMQHLQHNKTIVVDGNDLQRVVCGSTNLSWRGFFVQSNNALVLNGAAPVAAFRTAFDNYWSSGNFGATSSAKWNDLGLTGIDARVAFSPHAASNALLDDIADDIREGTTSSLFYSLAFLYQTPGPILDAIREVTENDDIFVYGISDKETGGLDVQRPDGNVAPVSAAALTENVPEPFHSEPIGGGGTRMHHKFVVIDFDKPTARVYLGSYNFSGTADTKNGENLLLIRDRRIAVSYVVEAVRIFDHYEFRLVQQNAEAAHEELVLSKPPAEGEDAWWAEDYAVAQKIRDRELFA